MKRLVTKTELKCYEYINAIKNVECMVGMGLYGADKFREQLHNELCELFGLDKDETKRITDNLDKLEMNGTNLYLELREISCAKRKEKRVQFNTAKKGGLVITENTTIDPGTEIPDFSEIGDGSTIGDRCTIGIGCKIGDWVTIGNYCTIGDSCTIGNSCTIGIGCKWLGVFVRQFITMSNIDGSNRQIKIIKHKGGARIEAGCFIGDSAEFLERAKKEEKVKYIRIVGTVINTMLAYN